MNLTLISFLLFLGVLGLLLSLSYFLLDVSSSKKQMRARLEAVTQVSTHSESSSEVDALMLRREVLSKIPRLNRILSDFGALRRLNLFLQQGGMETTVATLVSLALLLGVVSYLIAFLLRMPQLLCLVSALLLASIPFLVVAYKRNRRLAKFEELFPDAMDMLGRAVRAGHAFTTGLELIANEMPEPVAGEFRTTFEQQNLGLPLRDALGNLAVRVPLPDVRIFVSALQIQRESGGNLAEILDNLSVVVRERFKLLRQVRVYTSEGRLSLYILSAMPPIAAVVFFLIKPNYMMRLFTDPLGQKMIFAAVTMQVIGYLVIKKIVTLKV
jgi:tight adherence protein B